MVNDRKGGKDLASYSGLLAESRISIVDYENWHAVGDEVRDLLWDSIKAKFSLTEDEKKGVVSDIGEKWKEFKSRLTRPSKRRATTSQADEHRGFCGLYPRIQRALFLPADPQPLGSKDTQEYHWLGAVHVKDVSIAQVLLFETPSASGRNIFLRRHNDSSWKKSSTHYAMSSYIQSLLLWTGAALVCRALGPISLPSEASHFVKQIF
ncbi:hypothetical protein IFM89_019398 [Coptis chinensis]|uniref:Mechanosensitive channel protein 2/3 transmembrane domain-containing protein n=1 Tax=Coptis chinensis TaxID=261450 RepID=A0A835IRG0_9MAGN|nr:hypothetical protein IFM89_019398 [Coptis chinensis]